jgi:hypothetical protein
VSRLSMLIKRPRRTVAALGVLKQGNGGSGNTVAILDRMLPGGLAKNLSLSNFTLGTGASRTLSFRFYLPASAGSAYQGAKHKATYTWDAS